MNAYSTTALARQHAADLELKADRRRLAAEARSAGVARRPWLARLESTITTE
jgi:hypothetical protein